MARLGKMPAFNFPAVTNTRLVSRQANTQPSPFQRPISHKSHGENLTNI